MCRLLGFASNAPITLCDLLGEQELAEFVALSQTHGDGWGFARATASGVEVIKAPEAAGESAPFAHVARTLPADLGLVHLRWATLGLGVTRENTHPFTDGQIAFAHNGSVKPPDVIDALMPATFAARLAGTTDSERYFLATLATLAAVQERDVALALERTATAIAHRATFSSVNAMVATPDALHVINLFNPAAEAKEAAPHYYRMGYRITPNSVVVASSGWGHGWTLLENGDVLTVERATLAVHIHRC
jgi:predicted glutamine amidotransferase